MKTGSLVLLGAFLGAMLSVGAMATDSLDNFASTEDSPWAFVSDQVMGGVSTGQMAMDVQDGAHVMTLQGTVSTENNGGFIQVRREVPAESLQGAAGVYLIARGNGERYFVHLRSKWTILPWQYYQAGFDTTEQWQEIRVPFSEFKASGWMLPGRLKGADIRSLGVVAFGRDHVANVSIKEVGFY